MESASVLSKREQSTPRNIYHAGLCCAEHIRRLSDVLPKNVSDQPPTMFRGESAAPKPVQHGQAALQTASSIHESITKSAPVPDSISISRTQYRRLMDEFGRFKLWVRNVGADEYGRKSLDNRLQEARIHDLVFSILCNLSDDLQEGIYGTASLTACQNHSVILRSFCRISVSKVER